MTLFVSADGFAALHDDIVESGLSAYEYLKLVCRTRWPSIDDHYPKLANSFSLYCEGRMSDAMREWLRHRRTTTDFDLAIASWRNAMTVQLTTREKVIYEAQAAGLTIYAFFDKVFRLVNKGSKPSGQLLVQQANDFDRRGNVPPFVYRYFSDLEKQSRVIPRQLERALHAPP